MEQEQRAKLRKSMMGLLARREHSKQELLQKMLVKGFDIDMININIDDFIKHDWQSDNRFAEMLLRSRQLKCHGPVKIKMELKHKGVSEDIIYQCMEQPYNWSELASMAFTKKYSVVAVNQNEKNKQYRFLLQRGFTLEHIKKALKKLIQVALEY